MHVSIEKVSQFFWHASFASSCFDLIFVLIYSESGSLRFFFSATCLSLISSLRMIFQIQISQYNGNTVFQNLKSGMTQFHQL